MSVFHDRRDAGRRIAQRLLTRTAAESSRRVVAAVARGGVPVAAEVAAALHAPLEVVLARPLVVPGAAPHEVGAVAEGGVSVVDASALEAAEVPSRQLAAMIAEARAELLHDVVRCRSNRPLSDLRGRSVVLVDDGSSSDHTATAAARALGARGVEHIELAVPVWPEPALRAVADDFDALHCLRTTASAVDVAAHYDRLEAVTDGALAAALGAVGEPPRQLGDRFAGAPVAAIEQIELSVGRVRLTGDLHMPRRPCGVVVAVQERGGAHWPARRRLLPEALTRRRIAVLQLDLRSEHEADDRVILFDSELLAERLTAVVRWVRSHPAWAGSRSDCRGWRAARRSCCAPPPCSGTASRRPSPRATGPISRQTRSAASARRRFSSPVAATGADWPATAPPSTRFAAPSTSRSCLAPMAVSTSPPPWTPRPASRHAGSSSGSPSQRRPRPDGAAALTGACSASSASEATDAGAVGSRVRRAGGCRGGRGRPRRRRRGRRRCRWR